MPPDARGFTRECERFVSVPELRRMLKRPNGADVVHLSRLFVLAAKHGLFKVVGNMLSKGHVDPAACGGAAIVCAAENGHLEVVDILLLDGRTDPMDRDGMAINRAAQNGHLDIVKRLLQDNRMVVSEVTIRRAAEHGHAEVALVLLCDWRVKPSEVSLDDLERVSGSEVNEILRAWQDDVGL